ncbi:MAG: hypothetical protein FJ100_16230 [Deltaproteobacteria bacterium]|nr:hypothetical protein [Deltaproteobacteria bacterium]
MDDDDELDLSRSGDAFAVSNLAAAAKREQARKGLGAGVAGGAAKGAQVGTSIWPGWGTLIGAVGGAVGGALESQSDGEGAMYDIGQALQGEGKYGQLVATGGSQFASRFRPKKG